MNGTGTISYADIFVGTEVAHPRHELNTTKYAGEGKMNASELPASESTAGTTTVVVDAAVDIETEEGERCATCRHPRADHDALSVRFCAATAASGLARACICR
jgi:hypothetical protein